MKYNFESVKESLKSQGKVEDENIKMMLEILNQDLVPEPTNFKFKYTTDKLIYQSPIVLLNDGSLVALWNEVGLILKQYKNAVNSHVSWLYKCTPYNDYFCCDYSNEVIFKVETVLKKSAPIHSNLHYYKKQEDKLIQYFGSNEIVQALIVAYNTCISEQTLLKIECQNILDKYKSFYETESETDIKYYSPENNISSFKDILKRFIQDGSWYDYEALLVARGYILKKINEAEFDKQIKELEIDTDYVERGEWRDDGKYYPDWLGGMESEEDFWEH